MERLLTAKEIMKLAKEHPMLERWEQVQQQALALRGERAYKVEVVAVREHDNKCPATTCHVTIYDQNDNMLWQNGSNPPEHDGEELLDDETDSEDDEDLYAEVVAHLNKLDSGEVDSTVAPASSAFNSFPPSTETYWLDRPPVLSFPVVY